MKRTVTLLYHNPTERERLMARLCRLSSLTVIPVRWRAAGDAGKGVPLVCWCADVMAALEAKEQVSEPLLVIHPGQGEPLFSLLEDAACATCAIAGSDEQLTGKIERLRFPEAYHERVGEHTPYLTEREADVVRLLVSGLDTAQIAQRLGIKAATVTAHKKHIFLKIGVRSTTQLVAWALIRNRPGGERGGTE
ncbi:MAG TPA: helix-turn-helix transcriptional regulator [Sphaerochaeta sp.]|nr:helix-turn-helix transcriptional regulator [Spirochaetota bacterium]NLV61419.1 helix-turn-helix transcriptional regulator [Spirochaetales bacterium]HOQ95362.1 helix-turn-helix transcriptional regulator [Sphaerochaeta sp.]HPY12237.1 helix-turn-helix transcriptional regulator [Sphaerochaeta sp.]HQB91199.1 helix-turn-helix transcriptional regulator [Sphaerochaeta sp.]